MLKLFSSALQHLETLKRDKREILEALRNLHDWQNGCPLPSYEKQWAAAMEEAQRLFQLHEPIEGGKEDWKPFHQHVIENPDAYKGCGQF